MTAKEHWEAEKKRNGGSIMLSDPVVAIEAALKEVQESLTEQFLGIICGALNKAGGAPRGKEMYAYVLACREIMAEIEKAGYAAKPPSWKNARSGSTPADGQVFFVRVVAAIIRGIVRALARFATSRV